MKETSSKSKSVPFLSPLLKAILGFQGVLPCLPFQQQQEEIGLGDAGPKYRIRPGPQCFIQQASTRHDRITTPLPICVFQRCQQLT